MILPHYVGWGVLLVGNLIVFASCERKRWMFPCWSYLCRGDWSTVCGYTAFPIWYIVGLLETDSSISSASQEATSPEMQCPLCRLADALPKSFENCVDWWVDTLVESIVKRASIVIVCYFAWTSNNIVSVLLQGHAWRLHVFLDRSIVYGDCPTRGRRFKWIADHFQLWPQ